MMAALLTLAVTRWDAQAVLLPEGPGIRITVFGDWFPIRAVDPEILIGEMAATHVEVARNLRSIRGYVAKPPKDGARIVVRYGDSQEGILEEPFDGRKIRPLPDGCA
jgi:hypothetical protein